MSNFFSCQVMYIDYLMHAIASIEENLCLSGASSLSVRPSHASEAKVSVTLESILAAPAHRPSRRPYQRAARTGNPAAFDPDHTTRKRVPPTNTDAFRQLASGAQTYAYGRASLAMRADKQAAIAICFSWCACRAHGTASVEDEASPARIGACQVFCAKG